MLFIFFIQGEKGDEGIHGLAGVKGPDVRDLSFFKSSFCSYSQTLFLSLRHGIALGASVAQLFKRRPPTIDQVKGSNPDIGIRNGMERKETSPYITSFFVLCFKICE